MRNNLAGISRRQILQAATVGIASSSINATVTTRSEAGYEYEDPENRQKIPLKIGHRASSMKLVADLTVFQVARQISGLLGVELQISQGEPNFRDLETVKRFKKEAMRWGVLVPSLAGVWDRGVSIMRSPVAGINLLDSIRAAELMGSSVILVAFFRDNAPNMDDEASYTPVVNLLRKSALQAADSGVTLGLENSLSPSDNRKLVDLVDHPNVKVYYDPHNMAHYGHGEAAIPGIKLLGKNRICQVHVKNGEHLLEEPGPIDWKKAIQALNEIAYDGWYVFESKHLDRKQLLESTKRNIEFLQREVQMPSV